jgi:hypothetical protein
MPCAQDYLNVLKNDELMSYFEWEANSHGIVIPKFRVRYDKDSSFSRGEQSRRHIQFFLKKIGFVSRKPEQYSQGLSLESFHRSITELSEPCVFLVISKTNPEHPMLHVSLWITTRNAEGILICTEWHNWKDSPHTPPIFHTRKIMAVHELAVYYRKQLASRAGAAAGK